MNIKIYCSISRTDPNCPNVKHVQKKLALGANRKVRDMFKSYR